MPVMIWWKCGNCGYRFRQEAEKGVPEKCPSCKQSCTFTDCTCYRPECGGPESGNYDPLI